jgi:hypothetical protein
MAPFRRERDLWDGPRRAKRDAPKRQRAAGEGGRGALGTAPIARWGAPAIIATASRRARGSAPCRGIAVGGRGLPRGSKKGG